MSFLKSVRVAEYDGDFIEIEKNEVLRYLGIGRSEPDETLIGLINRSIAQFKSVARFRACYMVVPCKEEENGVDLGVFFAPGKSLKKTLSGCDRAILFAATTGFEAELQRRRAQVLSPSSAFALDSVGSAAIESFCDELCRDFKEQFKGYFLRPRFSPGYGDLPLETQRHLLSALSAGKNAGITLTKALLMIPQKSVSAIVGVGTDGCMSEKSDCAACEKKDCEFRL